MHEQRLQEELDGLHGDILGLTAEEYHSLRTGHHHYQNKSYAEAFRLDVHEAVRDHLMWLLDGSHDPNSERDIVLQITDEHGDEVPLVDRVVDRGDSVYATSIAHDPPTVDEQDIRRTEHGCQATLIPSVFQSYVSRDDVLLRITPWGSAESRTD